MSIFANPLRDLEWYQELEKRAAAGKGPLHVTGLSDTAKAHFLTSLCEKERPWKLVVTYDEASCLDGAQTAIDCGFDYLMGTLYYDSVAKLLAANGMEYLPFVGKVSGSPSILEGTNEEIIQNAKDLMDKGIKGFDILAYRHVVDGEKLAYEFCEAVPAKICIAGSINSFKRIDTMFDIGPWTFTMGSALFEKKFVPTGSFRDNLIAVAYYMAGK